MVHGMRMDSVLGVKWKSLKQRGGVEVRQEESGSKRITRILLREAAERQNVVIKAVVSGETGEGKRRAMDPGGAGGRRARKCSSAVAETVEYGREQTGNRAWAHPGTGSA